VNTKARYIVNADGKPVEVILPIAAYRKLMETIEQRDPDAGRPLKKSFAAELLRQEKEYATGKRGKPWSQVKRELGLA
jgi:PHD/YefM family antitoxin component YafN of YafNO toxin-antitoxin module